MVAKSRILGYNIGKYSKVNFGFGGVILVKIGIIDVNQDNIDTVKQVVREKLKEAEIVDVVSTGNEAVKMMQELQPDILLINISISKMNGIEVLKKIRVFNKNAHVIMLSEYDFIDFAREAIRLKVDDYLLSPVNVSVLVESLERVTALIEEEKMEQLSNRHKEKTMGEFYEYLDYSFIYGILYGGQSEGEITRYKETMGFTGYGYILNVELSPQKKTVSKEGDTSEKIYHCIKNTVLEYGKCMVGPEILNRIVIYIDADRDRDEIGDTKIAKRIQEVLISEFNRKVKIGIGETKELKDIYISYEEALRCLRYEEADDIIHATKMGNNFVNDTEYLNIESKMLQSIKFGKEEALNLFLKILDIIYPLTQEDKRNKILELLILSCHEVRINDKGKDGNVNYSNYFREAMALDHDELNQWAYQKFEYIIKTVRLNRTTKKSSSVTMAIRYMENHYSESVSLDDISRYIGVSPQHFSKIFKDETGINYVDWLSNLRISMAKNLLNEGEKTIKEICFLVGYNDPNYFSRIFKKVVGVSPMKYAEEGVPEELIFYNANI